MDFFFIEKITNYFTVRILIIFASYYLLFHLSLLKVQAGFQLIHAVTTDFACFQLGHKHEFSQFSRKILRSANEFLCKWKKKLSYIHTYTCMCIKWLCVCENCQQTRKKSAVFICLTVKCMSHKCKLKCKIFQPQSGQANEKVSDIKRKTLK